jgi:hypothetical protein
MSGGRLLHQQRQDAPSFGHKGAQLDYRNKLLVHVQRIEATRIPNDLFINLLVKNTLVALKAMGSPAAGAIGLMPVGGAFVLAVLARLTLLKNEK